MTQLARPQNPLFDYGPNTVLEGKYRLLRPLGTGGMGSVWAAHSEMLDITVAVKLIRLDAADEDTPRRVIQEARATARLADPGIVRMFEVGRTEQGDPFIVMELLAGPTLRQTIDEGPIEPVRAVRLLLPIVRALESARRAGVVHRDIKPENIVLAVGARGELQPKLLDFGIAKVAASAVQLTRAGDAVGSPMYMSPEQARGESVDHRTDLWSVCAVLYEAVLGFPPFRADNMNALFHAIITKEAQPLTTFRVGDAALSEIVQRGLAKNLADRWQQAQDLMLALAHWLRRHGVTEDVTGVALTSRGLGLPSDSPLSTAERERAQSVTMPRSERAAAVEAPMAGPLERGARWFDIARAFSRPRAALWLVGALLLALLGIVVSRGMVARRTQMATSAMPAESRSPGAIATTASAAAPPAVGSAPAAAAASNTPPSAVSAAPAASAAPRAPERSSASKRAPRRAQPAAPAPRPAPARSAPFKNPFD